MNILDRIVDHKNLEVSQRRSLFPLDYLQASPLYHRRPLSLTAAVRSHAEGGIIAEFKRRSPSRPSINFDVTVREVAAGYDQAGAAGMSVLTDNHFFGGSLDDLLQARASCSLPLLRKEFTIDPYQIHEARAFGADAILLIAAVLEPLRCQELAELARSLGLEVLLEVHDARELEAHQAVPADLIGVNNRNLKTFEVSLETSLGLIDSMPAGVLPISESGLRSTAEVKRLREAGYRGFLIGEGYMRSENPGLAAAEWIGKMKQQTHTTP